MRRLLVLMSVAAALASGARHERVIRKDLPDAQARKVVVVHRYGGITAAGSDEPGGSIVARVLVTAATAKAARDFAEQIDVSIEAGGDSTVAATVYPSGAVPDRSLSYEVNLDLVLPARAELDARNSFGDVHIEGLSRGSYVSNRYGFVEVERCRNVEIENRYGDVRLLDVEGPAQVDNEFGSVVLRRTRGRVNVENRYGRVDADGSNGDVHIANRFGSVLARHGQGRLAIANRYGRVAAWVDDPQLNALNLASELGRIELNVLTGLPVSVGGTARSGEIRTALPLRVVADSARQTVAGRIGRGGPAILLDGLMSDFLIVPESGPAGDSVQP